MVTLLKPKKLRTYKPRILYIMQWCRNREGQGGHWPSQYLAYQLTLFQPGEGRLSPLLLLIPTNFFTFRRKASGITVTEGDWTEGYCQNGGASLQMVRIGKDLKSPNRFSANESKITFLLLHGWKRSNFYVKMQKTTFCSKASALT